MSSTHNVSLFGNTIRVALYDPNTIAARGFATAAEVAAQDASEFADVASGAALSIGNLYANTTAGIAGTVDGEYFWTADPANLYLNDSETADLKAELATLGRSLGTFVTPLIPDGSTIKESFEALGTALAPLFGEANAEILATTTAGAAINVGVQIRHYADAVGSAGLDIRSYPGSAPGFILHCYSNDDPLDLIGAVAAQLDHIGNGTLLALKNAQNATYPGIKGKANFLSFIGYGGVGQATAKELGALTHQLNFLSYDSLYPYTFNGGLVAVAGTGHAQALKSTSLLDTLYAGEFYGTTRGVFISTTLNSGFTLGVVKNGTGGGTLAALFNYGTGDFLIGYNSAIAERVKIDSAGQYYVQGNRVLTTRQAFIADPTGGSVVDTECRAVVGTVIDRLIAHGLIAAS